MTLPTFQASPSLSLQTWYVQASFGRAVAGAYWHPDGTLDDPHIYLLGGQPGQDPKILARFSILTAKAAA